MAGLASALRNDEFCFHYQGKFDTVQLRLVGLEALLRWRQPGRGPGFPQEFVDLGEHSGTIVELGNWGIAAACAQLAQWRQARLPLVPVAVNLSVRQLSDPRLFFTVLSCLRQHDVPPGLLELEVTESGQIVDMAQACAVLARLRALGVRIALDDYGTGYAGLHHLKMLPVHTVKIDRCFIADIASDGKDAVIVDSTIALARSLALQVLAEGVEDGAQLAMLRSLGCQQVQGYYLHRPAPADAVAALLDGAHASPDCNK
ncbi:putative bifunctional diguanylate cyclase/phosphodiesterase [Janthinobacterium psychrotolerans]|uniref:EAL domain, c-di-GMP-specific phosphodiesterase class I (Or its enzymatically inactive variant) n=1 Tax=Janthinobacterium psychrotolerans TaxID=1747903 RepID=A0A1A7BXI1_9BURK|nr:EAL domain-containing protein [Janthinobacterium psychrotolerans]OBV38227.1 EAL domain, c-di-GMP-specific phosphodiesterase class I (or its enzymatically inactive variant) [Janthinobacterium psychrotolerans]